MDTKQVNPIGQTGINRVEAANVTGDKISEKSRLSLDRLTERCLTLCREALQIRQNESNQDSADRKRYDEFRKELGKLSVRHLTGNAMFFRSIAAEYYLPERAHADWRALLRQTGWVQETRQHRPQWLLFLGDRLIRAGYMNDACKAYEMTDQTHIETDSKTIERRFYIRLLRLISGNGDIEAIIEILKNSGFQLSPDLEKVLQLYDHLTINVMNRHEQLHSIFHYFPPEHPSDSLAAAIQLIEHPDNLDNLERYRYATGNDWQNQSPLPPSVLIAACLQVHCRDNHFNEALTVFPRAVNLGITVPDEWQTYIHLSLVIQIALTGNFRKARLLLRQYEADFLPPI